VRGKDLLRRGALTLEQRYYGNARIFRDDQLRGVLRGLRPEYALRRALRDIVPAHVLNRRKLGFPVPIGTGYATNCTTGPRHRRRLGHRRIPRPSGGAPDARRAPQVREITAGGFGLC